jgi:hypothetical protein
MDSLNFDVNLWGHIQAINNYADDVTKVDGFTQSPVIKMVALAEDLYKQLERVMEYTKFMEDEVKALEQYAHDHYEEGGHWVYETHDKEDYRKILLRTFSLEQAKREIRDDWELTQEQYNEVRAAGGEY